MKILIYGLNYHPEPTGIGKYTGELAEWLAKEGHDVRVVTAPPYYPKWKVGKGYSPFRYRKEVLNGVHVFRCPLWIPGKLTGLSRILHLLSFGLSSLFVIIYAASWRPNVVMNIVPAFFTTIAALLGSVLCTARVWLHIQDYELDAAFNLGILRISRLRKVAECIECFIFKKFDCISTISTQMLRKLYQKGIDTAEVFLLPNWVDTNQIFPLRGYNFLRNEIGLKQDDFIALYSGSMGEKQGLEVLVDVARKLEKRTNIKFVLCGEGPAKTKLKSLSSDLRNLCFLSLQPRQKLNLLLNLADIHLLPQKPETTDLVMPSKLTGIFASGKPVVSITNTETEIYRVVKSRGIIVKPGDIEGFVDSIVWLADHPNEREKLGKAGRIYAVDRLDKNNILTKFEKKLFEQVKDKKYMKRSYKNIALPHY